MTPEQILKRHIEKVSDSQFPARWEEWKESDFGKAVLAAMREAQQPSKGVEQRAKEYANYECGEKRNLNSGYSNEDIEANHMAWDSVYNAFLAGASTRGGRWVKCSEQQPNDFDEQGHTQPYLVYIDNPFFKNGNYHVAYFQKNSFGDQYNNWCGIESNVSHGDRQPNVTHWMPLPEPPLK